VELRHCVRVTIARYAVPEQLSLEAALEALRARFELEAEPAATGDRVLYETFDGLVRGDGLSLRWEAGRIVLSDPDDREHAAIEQPRALDVVSVADLPSGDLRERLAQVIGVRAAIRVATVRIGRRGWRMLDAERKTVVRLLFEQSSIDRATLTPRLSLVSVRGYDKALARARRVMERDLELAAPGESLADEAVRRSGGTVGGISSKLHVDLEPGQRADRAAVAIVAQLTAGIEANLPGALANIDTEFLHDLRVAVRRTRSLQRELRGVFPPDELARWRAEFRWLQEITGPSRDLDVYVLEFDDFARTLREPGRSDLEPLRALLVDRRRRERARMVRALRAPRTKTLLEDWKRLVERLPDLPEDDRPDAARPIADVAGGRIAEVYRQMVKMGGRIDEHSPPVALHDLRKKGKELRYLLEFFAALYPPKTVGPMVATLKSLQDTLGRFQDREVQAGMLRAVGDEVAGAPEGAVALMAMGMLVERLENQQAQARAEFAERFAPFAAKRRRDAVKETFG
jgi:CHAD domain-containing protein